MLATCFKTFEFCIPTKSTIVPTGSDWPHEVKYDGYCLRIEREESARLITRGRSDWPTALKSKATSRSLLPARRHLDALGCIEPDLVA